MSNILDNQSGFESFDLISRRQQTKIDYLLQDNAELLLQVQKLESTLSIYRDSLEDPCKYEIQALQKQVKELQTLLQKAETRALLNEQVGQEAEGFYQDVLKENEDKIHEMRRMIHDKEYTIQEMEKTKPHCEDNIVVKYKELIQLNEISLKYHNELENYQISIQKLSQQVAKLADANEKLQGENQIYKFELQKIKTALQNRVNYGRVLIHSSSDPELVPMPTRKQFSLCETRPFQSFLAPKYNEIERYKKLFEREAINNKILLQENHRMAQHIQQLEDVNSKLLNQIQKSSHKISHFKEQQKYYEHMWQAFLQSQGEKEFRDPEQFVKYEMSFEEFPEAKKKINSYPELPIEPNKEIQEYKAYLLQMHKNIHTLKEMKLLIPRTCSEPPKYRKPILHKRIKRPKVDISIISNNKKRDVSFISEYIF